MNHRSNAHLRIGFLVLVAALGWLLACRPAWSPDGKQLLYAMDVHGQVAVACHDLETGVSRRVFVAPRGHRAANPMWLADGKHAVVLSAPASAASVTVSVLEVASATVQRTFEVARENRSASNLSLATSVVLGDRVYFSAGPIACVDLVTGKTTKSEPVAGESGVMVAPAGDGLCYTSWNDDARDVTKMSWEIGLLDPQTLERSPVLTSAALPDWRVLAKPAFSPDKRRLALAGVIEGRVAIAIIRDSKIESQIRLGDAKRVLVNELCWCSLGATVYTTVRRSNDRGGADWSLHETAFSGSVARETRLFAARQGALADAAQLGLSLSPDGRQMALVTSFVKGVPQDQRGLYLVDLAAGERKVTRLPFPAVDVVKVRGSDAMLQLARGWQHAFAQVGADRSLAVSGGGSGAGLAALRAGLCDVAMLARRPRDAEHKQAKQAGIAFVEHCVSEAQLAVCVHKDNPIASLTVEQLSKIYRGDGVSAWSDLGVTMPEGLDRMTVGHPLNTTHGYRILARKVLRQQHLRNSALAMTTASSLAAASKYENALVVVTDLEAARKQDGVRIVPIAGAAGQTPCLPGPEPVTADAYPLAERYYLVTKKGADGETQAFLEWLRTDVGRAATREAGFLPAN